MSLKQSGARSPLDYTFTRHAVRKLRERSEIRLEWIDETIKKPAWVEDCFPDERHYVRKIAEFENRWLRVVVNPRLKPPAVVTVHFDAMLKKG